MKDDDQKIMWEAYEQSLNKEWDEHDQRDKMEHMSRDYSTWSAEDTIEWYGEEVMHIAVEFLDKDLVHPKVTSYEDIHDDLKNDLAGYVVHELQKKDKLPKRLDYHEHEDEYMHLKNAIEKYIAKHFQELVDLAGEQGIEHDPSDVGHRGYDQEPPAVDPASPRDREVARRASLGSAYRPDEEDLDFGARDRD